MANMAHTTEASNSHSVGLFGTSATAGFDVRHSGKDDIFQQLLSGLLPDRVLPTDRPGASSGLQLDLLEPAAYDYCEAASSPTTTLFPAELE